jgi:hypothetical protein
VHLPLFINLATWSTLIWDVSFPALVWSRLRRFMLLGGIALHLGIESLMYIPMFSWIMMSTYAVFLRPDEIEWLVDGVRRRIKAVLGEPRLVVRTPPGVASPFAALLRRIDTFGVLAWAGEQDAVRDDEIDFVLGADDVRLPRLGALPFVLFTMPPIALLMLVRLVPGGGRIARATLRRWLAAVDDPAMVSATSAQASRSLPVSSVGGDSIA